MKRSLLTAAVLAVGALTLACPGTSSTPTTVGISGASDLAFVNDLVFVTATDSNELRVLDLNVGGANKADWVRAPNPLSPLSIPVADRPIELARDVHWTQGSDGPGSYVFSRSANAREVSVVGATRESLVELKVVRSFNEEITAIAGRGNDDGTATLYVATYDGTFARLRTAKIPALGAKISDYPDAVSTDALVEEPCAAILSVLVLPDPNQVAYSLRRTPNVAQQCASGATPADQAASVQKLLAETSILLNTAANTRTVLEFGTPMRRLFTNADYSAAAGAPRPAANRIYGVIDETSCTRAENCRGVLAVEGPSYAPEAVPPSDKPTSAAFPCSQAVGKIACDPSGLPMVPIQTGSALIMGAAVGAAAANVPVYATPLPTRLTGVLTRSDGQLQLWDAENLIDFDVSEAVAGPAAIFAVDPAGTVDPAYTGGAGLLTHDAAGAQLPVTLANGAARDEQLRIELGAPLPGFVGVPAPAGGITLVPPIAPAGEVETGDLVVISGADAACTGVHTVTAVTATTLTVDATLPTVEGCAFTVEPSLGEHGAVSAHPWIVFGTVSGFLGRIAAGEGSGAAMTHFELPADPARRNALFYSHQGNNTINASGATVPSFSFDAANPPALVAFDFSDPFAGPPPANLRGYHYVIQSSSNFVREAPAVDPREAGNNFILPARVAGSVVFRPGTTQIVVSYPSDNYLLRIDTVTISTGSDLTAFTPFT